MAVASSHRFPFCVKFCLLIQCSVHIQPILRVLPVWIHLVCTTTHETGRSLHLVGRGWQQPAQRLMPSSLPFDPAAICVPCLILLQFNFDSVRTPFTCKHSAIWCILRHGSNAMEHGACDIWPPYMTGQDCRVSTSWCCRQRPATVCSVQWPTANRICCQTSA
jgi:hypothetical protein